METRRVRQNGKKCLTTGGWWHRMWECSKERVVASLLSSNCRRHDAPALFCACTSVTLIGVGCRLLRDRQYHHKAKMVAFNWKALENFPLLMYILAAKTLILCLAFAGVKMYQSKKLEEKLKRQREEKLKAEAEKKDD